MRRWIAVLVLSCLPMLVACSKDVSKQAQELADKVCACKDFDCTKPNMAELNKLSVKESEAIAKLGDDAKAKYKAAQSKAADCQNKLRAAK